MSEGPASQINAQEAQISTEEMFQKKYEFQKSLLERNIEKKIERLTRLREITVPQKVLQYEEKYGRPPTAEWIASFTIEAEQGLKLDQQRLEFLRPASYEDISYRDKVYEELPKLIRENCPSDLPLRFHGTPIYRARDILHSKGLSSSVDRLGQSTSYDVSDQVSVTTPDSISTTINGYTGLTDLNYNVPAGVMFVLLPSSPEEAEGGVKFVDGECRLRKSSRAALYNRNLSRKPCECPTMGQRIGYRPS